MADRAPPKLASVTIRRLVLPDGEAGHELDDAIAAALAHEFGNGGGAAAQSGVARAVARGIARHPEIAGTRRNANGDR